MNRYGDLLRDLRNPNLSRQRLDEIVRIFNELSDRDERYRSWLRFMDYNPRFDKVVANTGEFNVSPIEGMQLERNTAQSIAHNTETTVAFNGTSPNTNLLQITGVSGKLQLGQYSNNKAIGVIGVAQWAQNGAGRRAVHLNVYDSNDVLLYGTTLHSLLPTGIDVDVMPFASGLYIPTVVGAQYLRMTVIQTSGGALNLELLYSFFFAIR